VSAKATAVREKTKHAKVAARANEDDMTAGFANFVGYLAAGLTTSSFVPQVVRVVRTQDTRAISVLAYAAFCLGVAGWLVYGIALGSPPIIIANGITLVLASIVLAYKIRLG
jgi:MtN3 and saliva related transmembrane protein